MKKLELFENLKSDWSDCSNCDLCKNRTQLVFGHGNLDAKIMLLGEAPGKHEDLGGKPFSGRAGELLTKIIDSLDLDRQRDFWITNTVLCRPPQNRNPRNREIEACRERFERELKIVKPKVLVLMGNIPLLMYTGATGITKHRGLIGKSSGIPNYVFATFHPAALIYDKSKKKLAWKDWKEIKGLLNK